jgi:hypothetical protein
MTPTKQIKRSYRLIKVTADVTRDNWVGKDIDFIVQPNKDMIDDTTRGGPNRLLATYIVLGNRIPVTVNSHATITREEGLQDLQVSIVDGQSNYIDISNVRYVVSCELEEHFTYAPPKKRSLLDLLDLLVGGPMGDPEWMFIIDEQHKVFVGKDGDVKTDYVYCGYLVQQESDQPDQLLTLDWFGVFDDNFGNGHKIGFVSAEGYLFDKPETRKKTYEKLTELVYLLLAKIEPDAK